MMPGPMELIVIAAILAITVLITVVPFWMIASKAGFPGWISLATLVPLLNIALLFFLACAPWPALRGSRETTAMDT